jgi:hypothetical protein
VPTREGTPEKGLLQGDVHQVMTTLVTLYEIEFLYRRIKVAD